MRFKHISIKNFRNFNEVNIEVDNKNIVFGRNDFGKTNFLYALRYMFDSKIRRFGFAESEVLLPTICRRWKWKQL